MTTPLLKRFGDWIGTWRGAGETATGGECVMEFSLHPVFNGYALRIDTLVFSAEDGRLINGGAGYLTMDEAGRVTDTIYSIHLGFAPLHEEPDDPGVLSVSGRLADNRHMNVTISVVDDELTLSSRVTEGYPTMDDKTRTYTRMRRVHAWGEST